MPTEVWAELPASSGTTYIQLGSLPASSNWQQSSLRFTTPRVSTGLTIFHIINQIGTLSTDSFSLTQASLVPNGSLEQTGEISAALPSFWRQGGWGANTRSYKFLATGHTGGRSIRTDISKYTAGDSKWFFLPQPVKANTTYSFSDFYQSNIASQVVAAIGLADGATTYLVLGTAGPSNNWKEYQANFTTPANAQSVSIYHLIAAVGYLITDDYSLTAGQATIPSPGQFSRGLVTIAFDDGWQNVYSQALPLLRQYNIKTTQYIATGLLGAEDYMTPEELQVLNKEGHHITSHTVDHFDLTTLTDAQLTHQLADSKARLELLYGPAKDLALPYGAYNARTTAAVKQYYRSQRSSDEGLNGKTGFNVYNLRMQAVFASTTQAQLNAWLQQAAADKSWLILDYHNIGANPADFGDYTISPAVFATQLQSIVNSGLPVVTVDQALNELLPQL